MITDTYWTALHVRQTTAVPVRYPYRLRTPPKIKPLICAGPGPARKRASPSLRGLGLLPDGSGPPTAASLRQAAPPAA